MQIEIQAKNHEMKMRSRQKVQAKETKKMRRNVESWRETSEYLWSEKATMSCIDALCSIQEDIKLNMINIWK